jgi:hypothetical protein
LARLLTGRKDRTASARMAGMGAFERIIIFGGAERQSIFYVKD